ncbi:MAG: hypothetical protein N3B18_01475 [Desulfobacterota bacterium]|nr:hypothetical protein [Thermodesulfobacteriota bacterium]
MAHELLIGSLEHANVIGNLKDFDRSGTVGARPALYNLIWAVLTDIS